TTSTDHTITLSNIGANLNTSGARLQLFSGTCAGLTSVACGTTSISVTTLARSTTYYIRVYSAGAGALTSNAGFNICVTHPAAPTPLIDLGKSFINISKPSGGTVEPNDILEIRASVVVRAASFDSCRFTDIVPAGTSYIASSLKVLTNEGKSYKAFTDARFDASNDEGWISGANITINMGHMQADQPATVYRRGRIRNDNGHEPSFYGGTCILVASYRVQVTAAFNTQINTGGGTVTYTTAPPAVTTFTFPSSPVMVYNHYTICSNIVGVNSLGTETNGTFGSGNVRNRGSSGNVPAGYNYANFTCSSPQDYSYGIANNTGGGVYTTSNTWPKPDASCSATPTTHRVFTLWDIIGDHTGAASPTLGNPAADTTGGKTGGYMLIINAAYRIDSAFNHTISGLCANTYYEISCWMRNICSKCGCDSNGVGASGAGYIPSGPGDSSGVRPNLAIALDGVRYYTSGDLAYNGQWVKKGFTFRTGALQTSFTMRFYNNAPGGGGNDWALDDISVVTCSPDMNYGPSHNPIVCDSNAILLTDTVRSFFNNYTYYKWQRSTNGGGSWTDVTGTVGPVSPAWTGSEWQYVASYTIPPAQTLMANNGNIYRVIVATTTANLSDVNCRFIDAGSFITLQIIDCGIPLSTRLLSFSGRLLGERGALKWTTTGENEPLLFDVEKSTDGINYLVTGTVNSYNDYTSEQSTYTFIDPSPVAGKTFYRIRMKNVTGQSTYSRIIQLSTVTENLSFVSVINPFGNNLVFEVAVVQNGKADAELIDAAGKSVKKSSYEIAPGVNRLVIENTELLAGGIYFLRIKMAGNTIQKRVVKQTL
ncbi:MAG: T9SS type A sorting domain-containing protein, partial [Ferruginibacter sp.]|nr:T9SS type A sorting domain-containing protein [Chitinophagaceae bacterium]